MNNDNSQPKAQEQLVDYFDLVTHIPVGVCKFLLDDFFTALYSNDCLYTLFGYTPEQLREECQNKVSHTFWRDDREDVMRRIKAEHRSGAPGFRVEHRLVKRDGTVIWVLASGNFTTHGGVPAAHAIIVDITEQKQVQEQLRINEQRFRLALAQTDSTIFDYDIATKVMIHADKSAEKYGLTYETQNVPDCLVENQIVHPDCADDFLEMYRQIREGSPTASCVIRAKTTEQRYIWQKITMTTIYDRNEVPVRAVGILEDIDQQTRREARLLEQSQRDALTGLYNKRVTEKQIQVLLAEQSPVGALFIIDLDAFKTVNDQHGHQFGDLVLMGCARRLTRLFRPEDVIGRIGGDEFFVYLHGTQSRKVILRKAAEICASFAKPFTHNAISQIVTCTVGIAVCPADGISFDALYLKADTALYTAKRNGKNQFCLYAPGMTV